MTSDTYNLQGFIQVSQTLAVRAQILLVGGIILTMAMDRYLSLVLCTVAALMILYVLFISSKGVPMFDRVQSAVDDVVHVMRESITGIRVVKALSREEHEKKKYGSASSNLEKMDRRASTVMALPGPVMTLFLNIGLTLVVITEAYRVDSGDIKPGVILAFLTYFSMILMGVMGFNRIFMQYSKANASARRIAAVIDSPADIVKLPEVEAEHSSNSDYIVFDNVTFNYVGHKGDVSSFAFEERRHSLENVSFSIKKGGSLGIIGATGSGKTTIVNLLMRFYDADKGNIFIDGKDIRTYELPELRRKFGAVFQNDTIFSGTIEENNAFGRKMSDEDISSAIKSSMAFEFISRYEDGIKHTSSMHGANFSGGQKQRIMIARALYGKPEILVLDDSSSALDYRTDADLRKSLMEKYSSSTRIEIAQRVSSIMNLDEILVLDEGIVIGKGRHEELLENCSEYREIYRIQMEDNF